MADLRGTMLRHGHAGYRQDRGPYAESFRGLWASLREFRRRAARLAIRVGPDTELSRTTRDAIDHVVAILELVDQALFLERIEPKDAERVLDRGEALEGFRKRYVELAHEAAVVTLPRR
jgi:hypothetical protein